MLSYLSSSVGPFYVSTLSRSSTLTSIFPVYDLAMQTFALSMIPHILTLEPASNARMLALFIMFDVMGVAAGNAIIPRIYLSYGYRVSGAASFGFTGLMCKVISLLLKVHCTCGVCTDVSDFSQFSSYLPKVHIPRGINGLAGQMVAIFERRNLARRKRGRWRWRRARASARKMLFQIRRISQKHY